MNYEELVSSALKGDEESFYILINEVQEKLYVIAYSYVLDRDEALDLVQEAIIKGYKSLDKLKEARYFKSYITKILINLKEIAELTKTPLGTVKTNLNKALKMLRINLSKVGVSNEWKGI